LSAVGDFQCGTSAQNTVNNIRSKNPNLVLALGDYSYSPTATCWLNIIQPIKSITKIAIGNHEDDDNEDYSKYISQFGLTTPYYSFNYNNYVHVIVMDSDRTSFSSSSAQFNFVKNDLQAASQNPNIKWIIVSLHKPLYSSPNTCSDSACDGLESFRDIYHPLFDQYGVDLVLEGHTHSYQRTYPLKFNSADKSKPIQTSTNKDTYSNPDGQIYTIVGTGGASFHTLSGQAYFTATQNALAGRYGILDVVISNDGNKLEGKFYENNGPVTDTFTITKSNSAPVANNQVVSVPQNTAKPITLTASDADGNSLVYTVLTQPSHGSLTGTAPSITYTPSSGYAGPDSFTFKANDGQIDSNTATVTLSITDTTPPTVTSRTPAIGATGVGVGSLITATFSEPVQSGTVTGTTFSLKNSAGTTIAGTVTYNSATNTATLTPSSALAYSTTYTATLTNGIKDIAGNILTTISWSFTTAAASSSTCDNNLPISAVTSSPTQTGFTANNAIDNSPTTRWWSTLSANPWIKADLGSSKSICSIDIAWADGNQRQYSFTISLSGDDNSYTTVFSGKSSGTTTSAQKYTFAETPAKYVKITITQSHVGSSNSIAQISEIDVFGKVSTSTQLSISSLAAPESTETDSTSNVTKRQSDSNLLSNRPPLAKDDRIETSINEPIVASVLNNDVDSDGDKVKILSIESPTKQGGKVTIGNTDDTITYLPPRDFVGRDSFAYTIIDENRNADVAKVIVTVGGDVIHESQIGKTPLNRNNITQEQSDSQPPSTSSPPEMSNSANDNARPKADAGRNKVVREGSLVTLDASRSYDKNGRIISHAWKQLSGPSVNLEHPDTAKTSFVAPDVEQDTSIEFELTVTNEIGVSNSDVVSIRILGIPSNSDESKTDSIEKLTVLGDSDFENMIFVVSKINFPWSSVLDFYQK
jgi:predicted MPP superfamily phosphohydrolase